jgi:hypothetical protein
MLGHSSVKQTEAYAITEQVTVGREMALLNKRINKTAPVMCESDLAILNRLEKEIKKIKQKYNLS